MDAVASCRAGQIAVGLITLCIGGLACSPRWALTELPLGPATRLVGGQTIVALVHDTRPAAVLVMEPSTCFSCEDKVREVIAEHRARPTLVYVVLSHVATLAEHRRLVLEHISVSGVLADRVASGSAAARVLVVPLMGPPIVTSLAVGADSIRAFVGAMMSNGRGSSTHAAE